MSKELEALKRIKKMYECFVKKYRDLEPKLMICEKEDFDNVENALKEKEQFEDLVGMDLQIFSKAIDINGLIENAEKNEKKLKALEIIKKKDIDIYYIKLCFENELGYKKYNFWVSEDYRFITQEEYDLLKEALL